MIARLLRKKPSIDVEFDQVYWRWWHFRCARLSYRSAVDLYATLPHDQETAHVIGLIAPDVSPDLTPDECAAVLRALEHMEQQAKFALDEYRSVEQERTP